MQYRRLGSSGLQLSALSFGAWVTFGGQIGRSEARNLIAAAYDNGINFFDNAEVYAKGEAETGHGRCDRRPAPAARWLLRVQQGLFRRGGRSRSDPARVVAQARGRGLPRGVAAPARGSPGSVLLPSPRSGHADRGNRVGDGRADPPGQGAVLGHFGMVGRADQGGGAHRARPPPARADAWSSRSTTCCTARGWSWSTRRCIPNWAWAPPSGRRWPRAC